jgi:hypothetical protein
VKVAGDFIKDFSGRLSTRNPIPDINVDRATGFKSKESKRLKAVKLLADAQREFRHFRSEDG